MSSQRPDGGQGCQQSAWGPLTRVQSGDAYGLLWLTVVTAVCRWSCCKCVHHPEMPRTLKICIVFDTCVSQCVTSTVLCLFVLNQRRGLLMFSLLFLFYTFLWGPPCEKGRLPLLEIHQQTWTTVFQKCQPLNWRWFWPFSPLSIPLLGIRPLEMTVSSSDKC